MPKLQDRKQESRFIALFVGRSGSGKTVAACSFDKPVQDEDFDGRIGGAQGLSFQSEEGISYEYYPPKTEGLITKLNERLESIYAQSIIGSPIPKTWILDSITNMTQTFVSQALGVTHQRAGRGQEKRGRYIGPIAMPGPEDYGLEAQATYDYIAFIKSLPFQNVIFTAHLLQEWGKPKDDAGDPMPYEASIVTGEILSCRPKIGENIQTSFDHIFRFERETVGKEDRYYVNFRGGIARTAYSWLPAGRQEWTRKNFKEFMQSFKPKEAPLVATNG
jgi:hypothetical protein